MREVESEDTKAKLIKARESNWAKIKHIRRRKSPKQSHWAQPIPFSMDPAERADIDGERSEWKERERCIEGADERQQLWDNRWYSGTAQHLSLSHWFPLSNKLDHFSHCPTVAPLAFLFIPPFSRTACATCPVWKEKKKNTHTHTVWLIWHVWNMTQTHCHDTNTVPTL